jgi:hypothetical protein
MLNNGAEIKQTVSCYNFIANEYHEEKIWLTYIYINKLIQVCMQI